MPTTPNYQRVYDDIRARIISGELKPGEQLPSGAVLQSQYGVGNNALRTAMVLLRTEGWVTSHQGKGVYVADPIPGPPND